MASLGGAGGTSGGAGLLDSVLAAGIKSGYSFTVSVATGTPSVQYSVEAEPQSPQTGQRRFYSDQSGVIRYNTSATATASDNPLQ